MAVTSKKQLRTGARTKFKPTPITAPAAEPKGLSEAEREAFAYRDER
jgi:hypothetical protein